MNLIDIQANKRKANKTKTSFLQTPEEPKQKFLPYNPYQQRGSFI